MMRAAMASPKMENAVLVLVAEGADFSCGALSSALAAPSCSSSSSFWAACGALALTVDMRVVGKLSVGSGAAADEGVGPSRWKYTW